MGGESTAGVESKAAVNFTLAYPNRLKTGLQTNEANFDSAAHSPSTLQLFNPSTAASRFNLTPSPLLRRLQPVTNARFGEEQAGIGRIGFDLVAQVNQIDTQVRGLRFRLRAPHFAQQKPVREHAT